MFRSPEGVDALRPQVAGKHFVAPGIGQGDDQIVGQLERAQRPTTQSMTGRPCRFSKVLQGRRLDPSRA